MQKTSLILLFLILAAGCKNNLPEDQEKKLTVSIAKNKVQFVNDYEFLYAFGKVDSGSRFLSKSVKYDTKGNAVEILRFERPNSDSVANPVDTINNIFDNKGRPIQKMEISYSASYDLENSFIRKVKKRVNKYELDRLVEQIIYINDVLKTRFEFRYGDNNKISESISYNSAGKLEGKTEYLYKNNREAGSNSYNDLGVIIDRVETMHIDKNHIQTKYYDKIDSVPSIFYSVLNDKGWVIENEYKGTYRQSKNKIEYNDWGLKISETEYNKLGEPVLYTKAVIHYYK